MIAALQATPTPAPVTTPNITPARAFTPVPPPISLFPTAAAATPTPSGQPLRIVAQGFGQLGHELNYAFVVENANPRQAMQNIGYRATFYNAAGAAVQTDFGIVQLVLPEQQLGQAQMVSLIHADPIDHVEVSLQAGRALPAQPQPEFTADQLVYTPGQLLGRSAASCTTPSPSTSTVCWSAPWPTTRRGRLSAAAIPC